jgi:YbgC/YbaW family acyl-CoA thioester hydrolase
VEFRDTDAAGIAHFSVFFNWMERAEHAFLRHLGWSVVSWESSADGGRTKISWPRVQATCDYRRPVAFEDVFGIQVEVERLGRTACTYRFRFLAPAEAAALEVSPERAGVGWEQGADWFARSGVEPFAEGRMTAVCCRMEAGQPHQSLEIPVAWRARLEPFVSGAPHA